MQMTIIKKIAFITLALAIFIVPQFAYSQAVFSNNPLFLGISPKYPEPGDSVSVSVSSSETDVDGATISWFINGRLQKKAIGETTFKFTAGSLGTIYNIDVVVDDSLGFHFEDSALVIPMTIDLLWEAETHTPPFYKGKALAGRKSSIKITSIPIVYNESGSRISANNLVYEWKTRKGIVIGQSGFDKNSFEFETDTISTPTPITLILSDRSGYTIAEKTGFFKITEPEIVFYENNPLLGVLFNRALEEDLKLTSDEIGIDAFPYFIGKKDRNNNSLRYKWTVNGDSIAPTETSPGSISLGFADKEGLISINLFVDNVRNIYEGVKKNITLRLTK